MFELYFYPVLNVCFVMTQEIFMGFESQMSVGRFVYRREIFEVYEWKKKVFGGSEIGLVDQLEITRFKCFECQVDEFVVVLESIENATKTALVVCSPPSLRWSYQNTK